MPCACAIWACAAACCAAAICCACAPSCCACSTMPGAALTMSFMSFMRLSIPTGQLPCVLPPRSVIPPRHTALNVAIPVDRAAISAGSLFGTLTVSQVRDASRFARTCVCRREQGWGRWGTSRRAGRWPPGLRTETAPASPARATEIAFLDECLDSDDPPASVVHICGPGGIGKSTLLREVARQARDRGISVVAIDGRELGPAPGALEAALRKASDDRAAAGAARLLRADDRAGLLPAPRAAARAARPGAGRSSPAVARPTPAGSPAAGSGDRAARPGRPAAAGRAAPARRPRARPTARRRTSSTGRRARRWPWRWPPTRPIADAELERGQRARPARDPPVAAAPAGRDRAARHPAVGPRHRRRGQDHHAGAAARRPARRGRRDGLPPALRADRSPSRSADGFTMHELVRKALLADLRQRNPELERDLRRRIVDYLYARGKAGEPLLLIDLAHLVENPLHALGLRLGRQRQLPDRLGARPTTPTASRPSMATAQPAAVVAADPPVLRRGARPRRGRQGPAATRSAATWSA